MRYMVLIFLMISCAGLNQYSEHPIKRNYSNKPEKSVIDKLDYCTEKYINKLGVKPMTSYSICNDIYRSR